MNTNDSVEWNVYVYDVNARKVITHNVFHHFGFLEDCKKVVKTFDDKAQFMEALQGALLYYYWCKSEWEIEINDLNPLPDQCGKKVDVYRQVLINWHVFSEYVWGHRKEIEQMQY